MDSTAEFDATEAQLIEDARKAQMGEDAAALAAAQAADAAEAAGQDDPGQQAAATAVSEQTPEAKPEAQPETKAEPPKGGDPKAALRASRRSEQRLRQQLEQANAQIEQLKTAKPAAAELDDDDISGVVTELEGDLPSIAKVGKVVQKLQKELRELRATKPTATTTEPEFIPEALPADIQEVVDEMPDLSAWQNDPDQTNYALAGNFNTALLASPKWKGKSTQERFAEVVRLVKEQVGEPSAKPKPATAADAQKVIDAAKRPPVGISDLRGGSPAQQTAPDYRQMLKEGMTDEELIASLPP